MKTVKKITGVLRYVGVVLLIVALVAAVYATGASNAAWTPMSARLAKHGVDNGLLTRLGFTDKYYSAMSEVVALGALPAEQREKTAELEKRGEQVEAYFASYAAEANASLAEVNQGKADEVLAWFENEFDFAAYVEKGESSEDLTAIREIKEINEYLDSLGVPAKGKLKPASNASYMASFYQELLAEQGDAAGSEVEFMKTVRAMTEDYAAQGGKAMKITAFMKDVFTWESYAAKLPVIQAEEANRGGSFNEGFLELARARAAGEAAEDAVASTLAAEYAAFSAEQPDKGGYHVFLQSVQSLLQNPSFDGSYVAVAAQASQVMEAEQADSFEVYLDTFGQSVAETASKSAGVILVNVLWLTLAKSLYILGVGIVLIIIARLMVVAMDKRLLAKRDKGGIEEDADVLLRVSHLKQYFRSGEYVNKAVDDVSFYVKKGEVFGLVGESGCGKTTTGRTIINLYDPTDGDVYFEGLRISSTTNGLPVYKRQKRNEFRERMAKMKDEMKRAIAAEPAREAALRAEYKATVAQEKAKLHQELSAAEDHALESAVEKSKAQQMYREKRKAELTRAYEEEIKTLTGEAAQERTQRYNTEMKVAANDNIMTKMQMIFQDPIASINPRMTVREIIAEGLVIRGVTDKKYIDRKVREMLELVGLVPEHADRYPHEFSGGQRQRIGIARAIVMEPELIIADEPISALDVSIQAQVINLLNELRENMGLTIMFIAHNLSVVKYFSDRIAVMYYGRIVEMTTSDELFDHPLHPYTKALLSAIPYPDPHYEKERKRIEYNPTRAHDYSVDKPSLREITPGHFIHCNDAEMKQYQEELGL